MVSEVGGLEGMIAHVEPQNLRLSHTNLSSSNTNSLRTCHQEMLRAKEGGVILEPSLLITQIWASDLYISGVAVELI